MREKILWLRVFAVLLPCYAVLASAQYMDPMPALRLAATAAVPQGLSWYSMPDVSCFSPS